MPRNNLIHFCWLISNCILRSSMVVLVRIWLGVCFLWLSINVKGRRGGLEIHKFLGIRYQECNVLLNYKGGETSQVTRRNHIPSLSSKDITAFHIILYMPLLYWTCFSVTQQLFQALNELFQNNSMVCCIYWESGIRNFVCSKEKWLIGEFWKKGPHNRLGCC